MAEVTAAMVKALRERAGAGMMDCKRALVESDGDMDKAEDWLRAKGFSRAAAKAGRSTNEGIVEANVSRPAASTHAPPMKFWNAVELTRADRSSETCR